MDAVDGHGVVLATAAAATAGVRRFLHVSAFPDAWRDRRMPADFEHYMKVKRQADVHVEPSSTGSSSRTGGVGEGAGASRATSP